MTNHPIHPDHIGTPSAACAACQPTDRFPYRPSECRYCQRYRRACGRIHAEDTRADWARSSEGGAPLPRHGVNAR